jgi:hypothetical protein
VPRPPAPPADGIDTPAFKPDAFERYGNIRPATTQPGKVLTADTVLDHFALQELESTLGGLPATTSEAMKKVAEAAPQLLSAPLQKLATDPQFRALPAGSQAAVVALLAKHGSASPADTAARATVITLATSPGLAQLSAQQQTGLLKYVGGKNDYLSNPARAALDTLLKTPAFASGTPAAQAGKLRDFLSQQTGTPHLVPPAPGAPAPKPSTLSPGRDAPQFDFPSGRAAGISHDVTIGGQTIKVTVPKNPPAGATAHFHSIEEVRRALADLPPEVRALVKEVRVNPGANPADAYWQQQYNNPNHVSYMTAGADGIVDIYPSRQPQSQRVLETSIIHETGHVLSIGKWGNDPDPRWAPYKAAMAKDGLVASQYAKSSPDDDFAEGWALYVSAKGTPQESEVRALMPERFKIFDQLAATLPH